MLENVFVMQTNNFLINLSYTDSVYTLLVLDDAKPKFEIQLLLIYHEFNNDNIYIVSVYKIYS